MIMDSGKKSIHLKVSASQYEAIKTLAAEHNMSISGYLRYMATILAPYEFDRHFLHDPAHKQQLEKDLDEMARNLEKTKRIIELIQRSVYSTALKVESQLKKTRMEAAQELEKDLERIEYLVRDNNDQKKD